LGTPENMEGRSMKIELNKKELAILAGALDRAMGFRPDYMFFAQPDDDKRKLIIKLQTAERNYNAKD